MTDPATDPDATKDLKKGAKQTDQERTASLDPAPYDPYATVGVGTSPPTDPHSTAAPSAPTDPHSTVAPSFAGSTLAPAVGAATSAGLRFHIMRSHARGGLGEVFIAKDEELNREVALKEIQDRHADNQESRSRFLLEAEITGGLEHPGIVPVYGLGTYGNGRPYYAMRFIRGDSLKEAIDRFHHAGVRPAGSGPPGSMLELRALLGRFVDVCNAIAYAHSRGILHRDLKPGNIMLGKYGETLVVDWGLAKPMGDKSAEKLGVSRNESGHREPGEGSLIPSSMGSASETQAGSALGTPQYMSPEQAAGRLDDLGPASDVYSLGATLYTLLTGTPYITTPQIGALLQKVIRGEFPRPREVKPTVPAPLEAICLKAMALNPGDRYATARALADDIEHWLADEPVSAWPEPWTVKTRRWIGKHRTLVTSVASAIVVAVVGLSMATVLLTAANDRERKAKVFAEEKKQEAEEQKQEAVRQEKIAVKAKDFAEEQKKIAEAEKREAEQQKQEAVRQEKIAVKAKDFADEQKKEALAQKEIAESKKREAEEQRAKAENNFNLAKKAVNTFYTEVSENVLLDEPKMEPLRKKLLNSAKDFYELFLKERAHDPALKGELGRAEHRLAQITFDIGDKNKAIDLEQKSVTMFEMLVAAGDGEIQEDLATSLHHLGRMYRKTDQLAKAEEASQSALNLWQKLVKAHPEIERFRAEEARTEHVLGNAYQRMRKLIRAKDLYQMALATRIELAKSHPNRDAYQRDLAITHVGLAQVLQSIGAKEADVVNQYREAKKIQRKLVDSVPIVGQYQADLARTCMNLGDLYEQTQTPARAEEPYREAEKLWQTLLNDHPDVNEYRLGLAATYTQLAKEYRKTRNPKAAVQACLDSLAITKKLASDYQDNVSYQGEVAHDLFQLAESYRAGNQFSEAETEYKNALQLQLEQVRRLPNDPEASSYLARDYHGLGNLYAKNNKLDQAAAMYDKALPVWEKIVKEHPENQEYMRNLFEFCAVEGNLAKANGKLDEALTWYSRIVDTVESIGPKRQEGVSVKGPRRDAHWLRADVLTQLKRYPEALKEWDFTLKLSPEVQRPSVQLPRALALARAGKYVEATAEADRLTTIAGKSAPGELLYRLAGIYAVSASSASADDKRPAAEKTALIDDYTAKAMKLLVAASETGYFKTPAIREKLRSDADLQILRDRPDFKKLSAD